MLTRWFDSPSWPGLGSGWSVLRSVLDDDLAGLRRLEDLVSSRYGVVGPRFDVQEDPEGVTLCTALPGADDKGLNVMLQGSTLTVKGEQQNLVPEGYQVLLRERAPVRFTQSFTLSSDLDGVRTEARLAEGVLTVRIPKRQQAQPRQIEVKVT